MSAPTVRNSCVARYLSIISRVAQSSAVPFRERYAGKMRSTWYLVIPVICALQACDDDDDDDDAANFH